MTHGSWSSIAVACALAACSAGASPNVPGAPIGPSTTGHSTHDAGQNNSQSDDDAGPADAGPADAGPAVSFCSRVPTPSGGANGTQVATWVDTPGDLILSRQVERWNLDCDNPTLTLEFSDGACPLGLGHTLSFSFAYRDVVTGVVHSGNNTVGSDDETPAIRVRYTRPARLSPHGTWGTCAGASGELIFLEEPVIAAGNYLLARYQLTLTACDGSSAMPQFVQGAFNLLLHTSIKDVCPDSMF